MHRCRLRQGIERGDPPAPPRGREASCSATAQSSACCSPQCRDGGPDVWRSWAGERRAGSDYATIGVLCLTLRLKASSSLAESFLDETEGLLSESLPSGQGEACTLGVLVFDPCTWSYSHPLHPTDTPLWIDREAIVVLCPSDGTSCRSAAFSRIAASFR